MNDKLSDSLSLEVSSAENNLNIINPNEQIRLLLVDDETAILDSLKRLFRDSPHQVSLAENGDKALELLANTDIDIIISDMSMPQMSGEDLLKQVGALYPEIKIIVLSGYTEPASILNVINDAHIYSYVQKPWDDLDLKLKVKNAAEKLYLERLTKNQNNALKQKNNAFEQLNKTLEEQVEKRTTELLETQQSLQKAYEKMQQSYSSIVKMLSYYSGLATPALVNHGERVAELAVQFARYINLDEPAVKEIETAALLHDIGLAVIDNEILAKPYIKRSTFEKKLIEQHAILGESTLMSLPTMHSEAKIIRHHHELYNGEGYPDQLSGKNIPLGARIILLANDYDDMTSSNSVASPMNKQDAVELIRKFKQQRYDPDFCDDFCQMILTQTNPSHYKNGMIRSLKSDQLEPGMLLHENLLSRQGMLLLTAGNKLTAHSIESIRRLEGSEQQNYTFYIDTESPVSDPETTDNSILEEEKITSS